MKILKYSSIGLMLCMVACGGSDNESPSPVVGGDDNPIAMVPDPVAATLIFPEDNTECIEGTIISETESEVNFQWNASENTDTYTITLTNLENDESVTVDQGTTERVLRLTRGTPYEWSVISRAKGTNISATSEKWRFYNEGPGVANYAPFPAEAVSPLRGAILSVTTEINLEWSASDIDNDLKEFEVYLGASPDNMPKVGTVTELTLNALTVSPTTTYFWQVKALDDYGNSSTSEVFGFKIN